MQLAALDCWDTVWMSRSRRSNGWSSNTAADPAAWNSVFTASRDWLIAQVVARRIIAH